MPKNKTYTIDLTDKEVEAVTFAIDQMLQAMESDELMSDAQLKMQSKHLLTAYTKMLGFAVQSYALKN